MTIIILITICNNVAFQARSQAPLRLLVLTKRETIRKDRGKDVD